VDHLQGLARQRGLAVCAELPAEEITGLADTNLLQQVLLNLLLNAMDASQPEQRVTVKLNTSASGGAEIAVCDQGCGIPAEHLARIFAPFFTTKEHGTGLGLANAARLVESFGGQLRVRSTSGHGSIFTVIIPPAE